MKTDDFDYDLPEELIANYPSEKRSESRLLVFNNKVEHKYFFDIINYLQADDLIILNNTSVIPARLYGRKSSGGLVEVFLERILDKNQAIVQIKSNRRLNKASIIYIENYKIVVIKKIENFFKVEFDTHPINVFNSHGHIPLPPYIKRNQEAIDKKRYKTVYADSNYQDSVAAPTAGLHFDNMLIKEIQNKGVKIATVKLNIGAGTFQPVKVDNIKDHDIHSEYVQVSKDVISLIKKTKQNGKKVIAVGTTALRAVESAFEYGSIKGYNDYTKLFIYPGYKFNVVDMLVTNFHLPRSTLLMLISAFIGHKNMKAIYKIAVDKKYRFLSYGDAMLLKKNEV